MNNVSEKNKLVQIKLPSTTKEKLDEIFAKDGATTPQALKMIATQIANSGHSPFTTMYYENYSEPVSDVVKALLREDELEVLGYLPDKSKNYSSNQALDEAFKNNLGL